MTPWMVRIFFSVVLFFILCYFINISTAKPIANAQQNQPPARKDTVSRSEKKKSDSFFLRKHANDQVMPKDLQGEVVNPGAGVVIENRGNLPRPAAQHHAAPEFVVPKGEEEKMMLDQQLALGRITLRNTDFMAGYDIKTMAIRFSPPPQADPWPLPQSFIGTQDLFDINSDLLTFNVTKPTDGMTNCHSLRSIVNRYRDGLLFATARPLVPEDAILHPGAVYAPPAKAQKNQETSTASSPNLKHWRRHDVLIRSVKITVKRPCCEYPTANSSEAYDLKVSAKSGITIEATEVWGVLYALETLSQLMFTDEKGKLMVRSATIGDWPRFRHRGLLLDSSRHFLPIPVLKKNIDAMVQNKFNVFHWHLSDDQSFPLYLKSFPNFAKYAAFSPEHVYMPDDVLELVEYARVRGVRIVPEIDSPGHVLSWRHLPVVVLTRCFGHQSSKTPYGDLGPLDPSNEDTYKVLQKVLGDIATMFPDSGFHAGGDEVPLACWETSPNITKYRQEKFQEKFKPANTANQQQMISIRELVALHNKRLYSLFTESRKSQDDALSPQMIMWEEAYENDPSISTNITMHVWKSQQNKVKFLIDKGYNVLFSQCWYLNYISYGVDWIKYYQCDPTIMGRHGPGLSANDDKRLLGGEVCIWGEYIDETNLLSTLWPRASAVGERLWSNRNVVDVTSAGRRLEEHRCRMIRRGLPAAPISGPGTCYSATSFVSATDLANGNRHFRNSGKVAEAPLAVDGPNNAVLEDNLVISEKTLSRFEGYFVGNDDSSYRKKDGRSDDVITVQLQIGADSSISLVCLRLSTLYLMLSITLLLLLVYLSSRRGASRLLRPVMSRILLLRYRSQTDSRNSTPERFFQSILSRTSSASASPGESKTSLD